MNKLALAFIMAMVSSSSLAAVIKNDGIENKSTTLKAVIGGSLDTQAGFVNEKSFFNKAFVKDIAADERHSAALVNNTRLTLQIDGKSGKEYKYGGYLKLNADTSVNIITDDDNIAEKVYVYFETDKLGRIEAGGNDPASSMLKLGAESIAKATGGIDGNARKWYSKYAYYPFADAANKDSKKMSAHFLNGPGLPLDVDYDEYLSKITYIGPKFKGLQFGVSYIYDTDLHGTAAITHTVAVNGDKGFRNIVTPSLKYETKFKDAELSLAYTTQFGKAKRLDSNLARHGINAWSLGTVAKLKEFSIAGSYGDWKKSGTPIVRETSRRYGTSYWTAGAAYEKAAFGASLTYFESKSANSHTDTVALQGVYKDFDFNRYNHLSLGLEYKLAPGLLPYLEVNGFNAKQSRTAQSNKGTVYLLGTKLSF